ncbi:hypothetical protein MPER_05461 [Moniliophthora perniciosa FA553]|nr:hypothetical protein MPER_05461 [Moniliophthora perniciosa FA553]
MSSTNQPNNTLYVNNLNDKVNKEEYALNSSPSSPPMAEYHIVASKNPKMRGQAFLVFTDLAGATAALRACEGMLFYDKPMRIDYAKTKSYATSRREDANFVPPNSVNASAFLAQNGVASGKRQREDDAGEGPQAKKEKSDSDDEEMEIDDDDDVPTQNTNVIPSQAQQPSARLLCTNLPQEVTDRANSLNL